MRQVKNQYLKERKVLLVGLLFLPIRDMNFDLNKSEFRDAVKLRYERKVPDTPSDYVCRDIFNVDHAMICKQGGSIIEHHNELRDLEIELLRMVCSDVKTEPVLQKKPHRVE